MADTVQPAKLSRRAFFPVALAASAGTIALLNGTLKSPGLPLLEDAVEHPSDLASRLLEVIQNPDFSHGYRNHYISYQKVIDDARYLSQKSHTNDAASLEYSALEIIGMMHQARFIRGAGNNIIATGEEIRLAGFDSMRPLISLRNPDISYNQFKALEKYERVIQIREQLENEGKKLPFKIGYGIGEFGIVADRDTVNLRMFETINTLLKLNIPDKYKGRLHKRGYELSASVNHTYTQ